MGINLRRKPNIQEQERLHGEVSEIKDNLSTTDVALETPSGVLSQKLVDAYKGEVSEQIGLYQQVQELSPIAEKLKLAPIDWTRPYTESQVNQRREEVATYSGFAEQMESMLETANQLGWEVSQSALVESADVITFAEQLAEQQRLSKQLEKFRELEKKESAG